MSYRIVIYTKRKGILIFIAYIIAEKLAKLQSHIASLKMHHTSQVSTKWVCTRTLQLATAHRNLWSHIASHALEFKDHMNTSVSTVVKETRIYNLSCKLNTRLCLELLLRTLKKRNFLVCTKPIIKLGIEVNCPITFGIGFTSDCWKQVNCA